jgi:hypothetical protein
MISKQLAGIPLSERPGPFYDRLSPGMHDTTIFAAPLGELDQDGAAVDSAFLQEAGNDIPIFLFLSDYPAIPIAISRYIDVVLPTTGAQTVLIPQMDFLEKTQVMGALGLPYLPPILASGLPATGCDNGEVAVGVTTTNGVDVWGFNAEIELVDRGLQDDQPADLTAAVRMLFWANGAVLHGPSVYDESNTAFVGRNAIILREDDYTQAMADAGNEFVDNNGTLFRIVGLHQVPNAPA